jgi:hypothetical protein
MGLKSSGLAFHRIHYFIGLWAIATSRYLHEIVKPTPFWGGASLSEGRPLGVELPLILKQGYLLRIPEIWKIVNKEFHNMTDKKLEKEYQEPDANRDPLTGEPGAHPVGTGVGAAGAGAAGAAIGGAIGGPIGAVIGAAAGAIGGGLVGKQAAEKVNPTTEDAYWRENHSSAPYYESDYSYDNDYHPAYRAGYEGYSRHAGTGKTYDEIEPELRQNYETNHSNARMGWEKAKHATRDAWNRVERAIPGDADRDRQ